MQVAVIGVGHVGASVAVALLQTGAARELLLHDHDHARAEGEAMDLAHGVPYYPRARVRAVTLDEAVCADVVVFAAGRNGRPGETRGPGSIRISPAWAPSAAVPRAATFPC